MDSKTHYRTELYRKEIAYDREVHDYAMYLDGELVGFAHTYHEAEITLDQLVFELLSGEYFYAALLDAAGNPEPDPPPPVPPGQGGDDPERGPYSDEEWAADCAAAHALGSGPPVWWELLAASPIAPDASPLQPSPPAGGDAANAAGPCDMTGCTQPGATVWLGRWPAYPVRLCRAHKAVA